MSQVVHVIWSKTFITNPFHGKLYFVLNHRGNVSEFCFGIDCRQQISGQMIMTLTTEIYVHVARDALESFYFYLNIVFQDWEFVVNDYTFAETVSGQPQPYGHAYDCASEVQDCHFGTMKVNLTNSGFTLHNEVDTSKCKISKTCYLVTISSMWAFDESLVTCGTLWRRHLCYGSDKLYITN